MMKKILMVAAASLLSFSALAQEGVNWKKRSMINFDVESNPLGNLVFDSSKARGQESDNDTQLFLSINYAYQLPGVERLQLGARFEYEKATNPGRGDFEDYWGEIGGYWNFGNVDGGDLSRAYYASLFIGYGWDNTYTAGTSDDEYFSSTVAVGKRFSMKGLGIENLTYTPEVALQSVNSKTGGALEYSQSLELRFLQFSLFW